MVAAESGEDGPTRARALQALALRTGAEHTPIYYAALRDRSITVQTSAADVLARLGDERAGEEMLAWLARKLRRRARMNSWDPDEVPCAIRFAERNGLLPQVADVLAHLTRLHEDERAWLTDVWPEVARADIPVEARLAPPDVAKLGQPVYREHQTETDPELDAMEDIETRDALARAHKRAARASRT
jgi:hypothetical protein